MCSLKAIVPIITSVLTTDCEINILRKIVRYVKNNLSATDLQDLSNKCNSINKFCKGDGTLRYLVDI